MTKQKGLKESKIYVNEEKRGLCSIFEFYILFNFFFWRVGGGSSGPRWV